MTQPVFSPLAESVRNHKIRKGMSWMELADRIGVNIQTLRGLTNEKRDMTLPILKRLANFFEWSAVDVGMASMYEPRHVRERRLKKEGKKREQKAKQQSDQAGDGPPE